MAEAMPLYESFLFSFLFSRPRLWPGFRSARVFERIHHGLFEPYSFKMSVAEAPLQYFEDLYTEIFRGRDVPGELLQRIQVLQVVVGQHFFFDKTIQVDQVADHASAIVHRAAHRYFQSVVVSVSMGIIAFSIDGAIFFGREFAAVQAVRSGKSVTPGEMRFHASP